MRALVIAIVLAWVGQATAAYAAAGVVFDVRCCCPSIDACQCHEHDDPASDAQLKRCGGAVREIAPAVATCALPEPAGEPVVVRTVARVQPATVAIPPSFSVTPDRPPF